MIRGTSRDAATRMLILLKLSDGLSVNHVAASMQHPSTANFFLQLVRRFEGTAPTFGEVAGFAGPRAYAAILLLFALPEALPLPIAGMSTILAIPLVLVSVQMILHGADPRVPRWLSQRRVPLSMMQPFLDRLIRLLSWLDRVARPRCHGIADQTRLIGVVCLTLALIIALPIPFGNMLPALCILATAVGMMRRDGILVAVSLMAGGAIAVGLLTVLTLLAGSLFAVATRFAS